MKTFFSFVIICLLIVGIVLIILGFAFHSSPAEGMLLAGLVHLILGIIFTVPNLFSQAHRPDCYLELQEDWQ